MANSHLAGVSATICDFQRQSSRAPTLFSNVTRFPAPCLCTVFRHYFLPPESCLHRSESTHHCYFQFDAGGFYTSLWTSFIVVYWMLFAVWACWFR